MIVRLAGGMGNQMFQAAFGLSVAKARNEPVRFEKHCLDGHNHRAYSLGCFDVDLEFANNPDHRTQYVEEVFRFDPGVYTARDGRYFVGNWQTEKYFDVEIVDKMFTLREPISELSRIVAHDIVSKPSCFIHVRRTDYLIPSVAEVHGNLSMDYYRIAAQFVRDHVPDCHFYVFSDEPAFCRAVFYGDKVTIVNHNGYGSGRTGPSTEHEDLQLMKLCDHAIIANSSFSWWGAWLGDQLPRQQQRIVIAPARWFKTPEIESGDICPERWVRN